MPDSTHQSFSGATGPSGDDEGQCWRCTESGPVEWRAHPDHRVEGRVPLCADGCWLPDSVRYCCHDCGRAVELAAVHLVYDADRDGLVPECLDCHRAVAGTVRRQ